MKINKIEIENNKIVILILAVSGIAISILAFYYNFTTIGYILSVLAIGALIYLIFVFPSHLASKSENDTSTEQRGNITPELKSRQNEKEIVVIFKDAKENKPIHIEKIRFLIRIVKSDLDKETRLLALHALEEAVIQKREVDDILVALQDISKKSEYYDIREKAKEVLEQLARKAGYESARAFFNERFWLKKTEREAKREKMTKEIAIPIALLPAETRCMVSHLRIHEEMDDVVICPFCRNFAKRILLEDWLKKKGSCPVCREVLKITDCEKVRFIIE
ncbi:MAG: hypothetical protein GF308_02475 [Candidatus Heimdallarchaeota archaeon]|nr:hypothetical protein [Candidatus Heimdallarchaeota archaeon]